MTVLVTTASRHGATAEIGAEIAAVLSERGIASVAAPVATASPSDYDAVILGSAVYMGRWLPPARDFVERHRDTLAQRPVWLFSSGPVGVSPPAGMEHIADAEEVRGARAHRVFDGRIDRRELGLLEKAALRAVHAPDGDYRDWEAVRAYANEIADELER